MLELLRQHARQRDSFSPTKSAGQRPASEGALAATAVHRPNPRPTASPTASFAETSAALDREEAEVRNALFVEKRAVLLMIARDWRNLLDRYRALYPERFGPSSPVGRPATASLFARGAVGTPEAAGHVIIRGVDPVGVPPGTKLRDLLSRGGGGAEASQSAEEDTSAADADAAVAADRRVADERFANDPPLMGGDAENDSDREDWELTDEEMLRRSIYFGDKQSRAIRKQGAWEQFELRSRELRRLIAEEEALLATAPGAPTASLNAAPVSGGVEDLHPLPPTDTAAATTKGNTITIAAVDSTATAPVVPTYVAGGLDSLDRPCSGSAARTLCRLAVPSRRYYARIRRREERLVEQWLLEQLTALENEEIPLRLAIVAADEDARRLIEADAAKFLLLTGERLRQLEHDRRLGSQRAVVAAEEGFFRSTMIVEERAVRLNLVQWFEDTFGEEILKVRERMARDAAEAVRKVERREELERLQADYDFEQQSRKQAAIAQEQVRRVAALRRTQQQKQQQEEAKEGLPATAMPEVAEGAAPSRRYPVDGEEDAAPQDQAVEAEEKKADGGEGAAGDVDTAAPHAETQVPPHRLDEEGDVHHENGGDDSALGAGAVLDDDLPSDVDHDSPPPTGPERSEPDMVEREHAMAAEARRAASEQRDAFKKFLDLVDTAPTSAARQAPAPSETEEASAVDPQPPVHNGAGAEADDEPTASVATAASPSARQREASADTGPAASMVGPTDPPPQPNPPATTDESANTRFSSSQLTTTSGGALVEPSSSGSAPRTVPGNPQ